MAPNQYENILLSAIEDELESYEYYQNLSQAVQSEDLRSVFKALAGEELAHRDQLQNILDKRQFPEFEAPGKFPSRDAPTVPRLSMIMKPQDGIALAIHKEDIARQDYEHMAALSTNPAQKKMFASLAHMEQGHREHLEKILASGSLPENW